jgi:hypothetical protein
MFSEYIIQTLSIELDKIFENDEEILTLACLRIDGPIFYLKTRIEPTVVISSFDARISALSILITNLSSKILKLNGDQTLRTISFASIDKKIAITATDFFIVFVETTTRGNAKAISKAVNSLIQSS